MKPDAGRAERVLDTLAALAGHDGSRSSGSQQCATVHGCSLGVTLWHDFPPLGEASLDQPCRHGRAANGRHDLTGRSLKLHRSVTSVSSQPGNHSHGTCRDKRLGVVHRQVVLAADRRQPPPVRSHQRHGIAFDLDKHSPQRVAAGLVVGGEHSATHRTAELVRRQPSHALEVRRRPRRVARSILGRKRPLPVTSPHDAGAAIGDQRHLVTSGVRQDGLQPVFRQQQRRAVVRHLDVDANVAVTPSKHAVR